MKLSRFMSREEYDLLMAGETLRNTTDHGADGNKTESVGFCFFEEDPAEAIEWLSFLVDAQYCVTMEVPDDLVRESKGRYRDVDEDEKRGLYDEVPMLWRKEYCTTEYSLSQVRILFVTQEYEDFSRIPADLPFFQKIIRLEIAGRKIAERNERKKQIRKLKKQ